MGRWVGKTFRSGKTDLMFSEVALKDKTQRTASWFLFFFSFLFRATALGSCRAALEVPELEGRGEWGGGGAGWP